MTNCFVIMPFRAELHYMYLFMKRHIETTFPGVQCSRGDEKILTVSVLDKIAGYIQQAHVVIADCTGRNPNVFYELGMAHAKEKPVILITSDPVEEAPTDIRAFEFIRYQLDDEVNFVDKLDRALRQLLGSQFDELFKQASVFFNEFRTSTHLPISAVTKDEFSAAASKKTRVSSTPPVEDLKEVAAWSLPIIIDGPPDLAVMVQMQRWVEAKFGA